MKSTQENQQNHARRKDPQITLNKICLTEAFRLEMLEQNS